MRLVTSIQRSVLFSIVFISATTANAVTIGKTANGKFFTIDGVPTYLNGISYYAAQPLGQYKGNRHAVTWRKSRYEPRLYPTGARDDLLSRRFFGISHAKLKKIMATRLSVLNTFSLEFLQNIDCGFP